MEEGLPEEELVRRDPPRPVWPGHRGNGCPSHRHPSSCWSWFLVPRALPRVQ